MYVQSDSLEFICRMNQEDSICFCYTSCGLIAHFSTVLPTILVIRQPHMVFNSQVDILNILLIVFVFSVRSPGSLSSSNEGDGGLLHLYQLHNMT
jgi:hypothetical protein